MISRRTATLVSAAFLWLAAHPEHPDMVVAGTATGQYLSRDGAETFSQLKGGQRIFAVAVEPSGDAIWYGPYSEGAKLVMKSLMPNIAEHESTPPAMHGDALAFMAFNPVVKDQMAISTTRRNVFISRNKGQDWIQIVHEGDPDA